jgi:hypothetical protein
MDNARVYRHRWKARNFPADAAHKQSAKAALQTKDRPLALSAWFCYLALKSDRLPRLQTCTDKG